jgi:ATP-dependent Clp protease ATP-binding subunit ClpB
MDIAHYSSDSREVIKNAKEVAASLRHPEIDVEHLLIAVVRNESSEVEAILSQLDKSPALLESIAESYLKDQSRRSTARERLTISPGVEEVLTLALDEKAKLFDPLVEPEHILIAIFDPRSKLAPQVRDKIELTKEDFYRAIADVKSVQEIASGGTKETAEGGTAEAGEPKKISGTLRYCTDMTNTAAAGEFDPVIGRSAEIQQVIQILLRRRKNSPVLVGGAGVGKSAIVEGFAQAVIDEKVPKVLHGVKVMEVDMGSMVAGAKYKGEFEERFKSLIGEVAKSAGRIVLFIDEVHTICGPAGGGGMDAANLLKPALARGQIRLVGATTEEEYTKYLEKDKALDRRFEKVKVEEPNTESSIRIVNGVLSKYEDHHGLTYSPEAAIAAVKYSQRYLSERNLPDVALDLVDEAGSEFCVKEEFARVAIPKITEQISEVEAALKACKGKKNMEGSDEYQHLKTVYDTFTRSLDRLNDFWGHRLEGQKEAS